MIEVFVISFVTSSISALTILVSGVWQSGQTSTAVVAQAFNTAIPVAGGWVVAFCAFLFGYTTLIGWAYYGEQFFEYLLGTRVTMTYRWLYCLLIPIGATLSVETVWAWGANYFGQLGDGTTTNAPLSPVQVKTAPAGLP
jgi:AGCS family alanine or glycine:cation symporter